MTGRRASALQWSPMGSDVMTIGSDAGSVTFPRSIRAHSQPKPSAHDRSGVSRQSNSLGLELARAGHDNLLAHLCRAAELGEEFESLVADHSEPRWFGPRVEAAAAEWSGQDVVQAKPPELVGELGSAQGE